MTKPIPKAKSKGFFATPHRLSDDARETLSGLLGFDPGMGELPNRVQTALEQVELLLGVFQPARKVLDHMPKSGDIRSELESVRGAAALFLEQLHTLSDWARSATDELDAEITTLTQRVGAFYTVVNAVLRDLPRTNSGGSPPKLALREVIRQLESVFDEHYQGSNEPSQQVGAVKPRSGRGYDKLEFIQASLSDAGIEYPARLDRYLQYP